MLRIARALVLLPMLAGGVRADDVPPAYDFLHALPGSYHEFSGPFVIPSGFFGPGSDPFTGSVDFIGQPLGTIPGCPDPLGDADIVVQRLASASLPCCPSEVTIPIEIVALSLVSVAPITVTYNGGGNPEPWQVHWHVSPLAPPPQGQMTIRHLTAAGGTFDAQFPVYPRFAFVKVQPQPEPPLPLDFVPPDSDVDLFVATTAAWSHIGPPGLLETTCDSNFRPGGSDQVPMEALSLNYGRIVMKYATSGTPTPVHTESWGRIKLLYR